MKSKNLTMLVLFVLILIVYCGNDSEPPVYTTVVPPIEGAKLNFVGYVADTSFELKSDIYKFSRLFLTQQDSINGQPVYMYISNNKRTKYYTDSDGDVWQYQLEDLSARLLAYGLKTDSAVVIQYKQPLLKTSRGKGTKWRVCIDTTFFAYDSEGKKQKIQYYHYGEAKYDGWSDVFVQERRTVPYRCMNAFWPVLNTYIINHTSGDSIFVRKGNARQMFEPTLGSIKYTTDFTLKEVGKEPVVRKGTWELISKYIPDEEK